MEERVARAKARATVLSNIGDASLQKYKEEYQFLTWEDNRKNKKTPLLRKDPFKIKTEDRKFRYQSRLNNDCKEFMSGKKYFSDDLSQSSSHELDKNYQCDGEKWTYITRPIFFY